MSIGRVENKDNKKEYVRYATMGGSGGGVSGVQVGNVQDLTLNEGSENLTLKWKDPDDVVFNGNTIAEWAGTKVVRKEGSSPESVTDGTLVADSTVKDQYAVEGLQDTGVVADVQYNYALFPYTTKNIYTMSDLNRISGQKIQYNTILSNNTWTQIDKASRAGIASDLWNVGDTKDGFQIIGFNHDNLSDGTGKAGITFLSSLQQDRQWHDAANDTVIYYKESEIYKYVNSLIETLDKNLQSVIKEVGKVCVTGDTKNITGTEVLNLKLFLLSYTEIFANAPNGLNGYAEENAYIVDREIYGNVTSWTRTACVKNIYKYYIPTYINGRVNLEKYRTLSQPFYYAFNI